MVIEGDATGAVPLTIRGAPGFQSNITEWQDSAGSTLAKIDHAGELTTRHVNIDVASEGPGRSPELHYKAANGRWLSGIDWTGAVPARDFVVASKGDFPGPGQVRDLIYCSHNDDRAPTVGIGVTQPGSAYRLQVMADVDEPAMGGFMVRAVDGQTGKPLAVRHSYSDPALDFFAVRHDGGVEVHSRGGTRTFVIGVEGDVVQTALASTGKVFRVRRGYNDPAVDLFSVSATGEVEVRNRTGARTFAVQEDGGILSPLLKADSTTNRVLRLTGADGGTFFDLTNANGYLTLVNSWTAKPSWRIGGDGRFEPLQVIAAATSGIQLPHTGNGTPSGGQSGEIRVGNGKLWVKDGTQWKSVLVK